MLRPTFLIALATIAGATYAQEPAKFSFKAPAAPAKSVLPVLGKAAGVAMSAGGQLGEDVLVLNLSDVTSTEAMNKIAETLHAEWRKEGEGYVLYRGTNLEAADRRLETATRVAEFKSDVQRILQDQQKAGGFNEDAAKKLAAAQRKLMEDVERQSAGGGGIRIAGDFAGAAGKTPSAHAIVSILARMSDAQIAAIVSGNRTVFSLSPTRMQRAMPGGANQILRKFVGDAQLYRDAMQRNQRQPSDPNQSRQIIVNGFGADEAGEGDPSLGIGYAFLISQPNLGNRGNSLNLLVADPQGRTLASGQYFVGGSPFQPQTETKPAKPKSGGKAIELSPLAKELAQAMMLVSGSMGGGSRAIRMVSVAVGTGGSMTFTSGGGEGKTPALSAELRARLLSPDKFDPLSFAPGEALSQSADLMGRDLVAYVPDTAFNPLTQAAANGTPTPSQFLQSAKSMASMSVKEEGGWLLVSPKTPAAERDRRVNRSALADLLQLMDGRGYIGLDDWAGFAAKQTKAPRFAEIDDTYLKLINTPASDGGLSQFSFGGGWQTLQFYASMSTGQRQTMMRNGRVPLGTLSSYQIGLVSDQVFNSFEGPSVVNPRQSGGRIGFMGGIRDALTERTVLLPTGLPRDGFLSFNVQGNEVVQANSTTSGGSRFLTADALAFERLRQERPELASWGGVTNFDQFRMGRQRTIAFNYQFTPIVSMTKQLEDNSPGSQPYGAYGSLPGRFREQVDQQIEQLRKSWSGGGGGNQVPPPTIAQR
jgi:hypothetical protein